MVEKKIGEQVRVAKATLFILVAIAGGRRCSNCFNTFISLTRRFFVNPSRIFGISTGILNMKYPKKGEDYMAKGIIKYPTVFVFLLYYSLLILLYTPQIKAETNIGKQKFAEFENAIYNQLTFSVEPLYELDMLQDGMDDEDLYDIVVSVEERLMKSVLFLESLEVPHELPNDIKSSLEQIKIDLSIGFSALGESMNYFTQYLENSNTEFYDKYIKSSNKGFLYVGGGITYLTTIRLKLDPPPEWNIPPREEPPNVWEVNKEYFYKLERAIQVSK